MRELTGGRLKTPIVSYVCEVDGNEEILVEQSSIGTPFYVPVDGEKVDVYIHPNPQKRFLLLCHLIYSQEYLFVRKGHSRCQSFI